MTNSHNRKWRLLASVVSTSAFLTFFIFLPTRSARMVFGETVFLKEWLTGLFSLIFGVLSLFLYSSIPGKGPKAQGKKLLDYGRGKRSDYSKAIAILFSIAILAQSFWNLNEPPSVDEYLYTFDYEHSSLAQVVNPFNFHSLLKFNQNHTLCNITSYLSTKWLGLSPWSLRLPSFFFTLGLLWIIGRVRKELSLSVTVALYVQLLTNGLVSLEFASAKGYVSMMLFSFIVFSLARGFTLRPEKISGRKLGVVGLALVLCVETHAFASIFIAITAASLVLWYFFHRESLQLPVRESLTRLAWVTLAVTPLSATILVAHFMALQSYSDVFSPSPASALSALGGMFGFPPAYWGKLMLCLGLFLFYERLRQEAWKDFGTLWTATSAVAITGLIIIFSPQNLFPRYFLAFYLPLWLWLTESIHFIRERSYKIVALTLVVAICVLPATHQKEYFADYGEWAREATYFVKKSLKLVPPREGRCYLAWGSPVEASLARRFYLPRQRREEKCTEKYYLYFTGLPIHKESPIYYADRDPAAESFSESSSLTPLFSDTRGRVLAKKQP